MSETTDLFDMWDDRAAADENDAEATIECKHCGLDLLRWEEARGERNQKCWVLVDSRTDEPHDCLRHHREAFADEFTPVK